MLPSLLLQIFLHSGITSLCRYSQAVAAEFKVSRFTFAQHNGLVRYNVGIARRVVADSRMVAPNC
jgi:hypothetical protein